jgi:hypothetical protein
VLTSAWGLIGSQDAELRCELLMLQAFIAKSKEDTAKFADAVKQLLSKRDPAWPAPLRARAMMFAVLSGEEASEKFMEELVETLADVQPPTLRDRSLEWEAYLANSIDVPERFVRPLSNLFTRSREGSVSGALRSIDRAHLQRLLGRREAAIKLLDQADRGLSGVGGEASLIAQWKLNEARLKLGQRTAYGELARRARSSRLRDTILLEVIKSSSAIEARYPQAARGVARLAEEPGNGFEAARLNWLATLPDATPQDHTAAREYRVRLGWTETKRRDNDRISIQSAALPASLLEVAGNIPAVIGLLLKDFPAFADLLSDAFKPATPLPEVIAIEPEAALNSLPWEIASILSGRLKVHRTSASAPAAHFAAQPILPKRSVLYVGPDETFGEDVESFAASSGGSLEQFYARHNAFPAVLRDADPRRLQDAVKETRELTLIHIGCTLRETSGGIYLDIEDTRSRGLSFGLEAQDTSREVLDLHLNVSRVDRALQLLSIPPFLVLDVAYPFNTTEAIRMLLLRNGFAAQLFDLGHVRGILGCGLASPWARYELSQAIVNALMTKSIGETMAELRERPGYSTHGNGDLEESLPGVGSALWTNSPDDRLFTIGT